MKKLHRTTGDERMIAGVLGGLAKYFDVDPTILRVAFFFITAFTGFLSGIIVYIVAILIIPAANTVTPPTVSTHNGQKE